jgi:phosphoenolpyruvate carboxylase
MGTYSEWDEEKKLEFLTRELKSKRPLVPSTIQVTCLNIMIALKPEQ